MNAEAYSEQLRALETLRRKGLSRTDVARLLGVTNNSVEAWWNGEKPAAGRARSRLLELAAAPEEELREAVSHFATYPRGRLTVSETEARVTAMKEARMWPPEVCASRLCGLIDSAKEIGYMTSELIEFLGVSRRTFYHYLSPVNTRPLPGEVIRRIQLLERQLAGGESGGTAEVRFVGVEERLERASLLLFGDYHYIGFAGGDPVKRYVLRVLAAETRLSERALRRYLPIRDSGLHVSRVVVAELEGVAWRLGALV